ncbi:MAG: hypothetical protein OEZ34_00290 [Spirochaetia bacterium]|nr:hypothetical protein [Spirochaetia bacterium]
MLPAVAGAAILQNMPSEVPKDHLASLVSGNEGEIIEITGESASPEDFSDPSDGKSGDDDKSASSDGKSGDDDKSASSDGKSGDDDKSASSDGKSGDEDKSASSDGKSGDEDKSASSDGKSGDEDTSASSVGDGDDSDGKNSLVRHGKDVCSTEGKWYKDANTVFTYEGHKSAGFCFQNVKSQRYEVVVKVKHWVKHNSDSYTIPNGYNDFEILISEGNQDAIAVVPANQDHWKSESVYLNISNPDPVIKVSLMNPYCDESNCVNLQILSVHLKKSKGSAIAASIKDISEKHYPLLLGVFILALLVIVALNLKNAKVNKS